MAKSLGVDLLYSSLSLQYLTLYPAHSSYTIFDVVLMNEQSLNKESFVIESLNAYVYYFEF